MLNRYNTALLCFQIIQYDYMQNLTSFLMNLMMKDMGEASSVLGMRVKREDCGIKIDQSRYIAKVLKRFGMETCHPISTPIDVNQKLTSEMCPKTDIERAEMASVIYGSNRMSVVRCIDY